MSKRTSVPDRVGITATELHAAEVTAIHSLVKGEQVVTNRPVRVHFKVSGGITVEGYDRAQSARLAPIRGDRIVSYRAGGWTFDASDRNGPLWDDLNRGRNA